MLSVVSILLASISAWFRSRLSVQIELIALRHQIAVYKQSISRPQLRPTDRLLWVWLSRLWPGWQEVLAFVQPRTVIAWQKKRWRNYWRRLSQSGKPGRPAIVQEVRKLSQGMWLSNPTWGSPRIVGELRKLGIDVAKSTVEKYRPKVHKPSSPRARASCISLPNIQQHSGPHSRSSRRFPGIPPHVTCCETVTQFTVSIFNSASRT